MANKRKSTSSKGKQPAKQAKTDQPATATGKRPDGRKTAASVKAAPQRPADQTGAASAAAVIEYLKRLGADSDLVETVQRLTPASSSKTDGQGQGDKPADASCKQLVKVLTRYVQFLAQTDCWGSVPKFLSTGVENLVLSIHPPGFTAAYTEALKVHGTAFCEAVRETTKRHLDTTGVALTGELMNWKDGAVVKEAMKIAKRRLQGTYGKKTWAAEIPQMLKEAVAFIPMVDGQSWVEFMETEEQA